MASDLLSLGTQSVLTAQRQLNTTGHNISNVNTEGYSRQSVVQATNPARMYGGQTYGMGVHVENVRRSWDQFAVKELNIVTTDHAYKDDMEKNIDMLSGLLSSVSSKKIPENLNDWFDSVKTLADSPNDIGARKVVLEKSQLIADTLNGFHENVRLQSEVANKGLELGVERVNQLALEIRDVQRLMIRTPGPHNDLQDQHEKLIAELAEYTKVTVTPRKNNEGFNVHIGNGHTLVSGTEASQLKLLPGHPDTHQLRLAMVEGQGVKAIGAKDIDGKIGALFDMRDKEIPHVMDEIGRVAASFAYNINKLQSQGLDLQGNVGSNMFSDVNSEQAAKQRVVTSSDSTADIAAFIEDTSQLKSGEYSIQYDGSDYVTTLPNGDKTKLSEDNGSLYVDGLRIEIRDAPKTGERFFVRPTRDAAANIKVAINDAAKIAAQSFEASTSFAQGSAKFNILSAGDLREFEVEISSGGDMFTVKDTKGNVILSDQPYPPSGPVSVLGTTFELTAGAIAKDKFTANLVPSEGDNGNLLKMQNIQTDKTLDDDQSTLLDLYHNLNTNVGLRLSMASRLNDVSRLEKEAAQERIASVSGVNLDEEAANMMKFQQAYMASSRIMQASNDTFNTILQLR
jgi:flagellar hook-associated protein 1